MHICEVQRAWLALIVVIGDLFVGFIFIVPTSFLNLQVRRVVGLAIRLGSGV